MKKILKWIGIVVLCLIVIVVAAALILAGKYNKLADKTYTANPPELPVPTDSASIARGAIIAASICSGCHGGDFSGTPFFDEPKIAQVPAPNITKGGRTASYTTKDWIRTIRYGVKPDSHGLFIMPSKDMGKMSDADLMSLIAYMQTVPTNDKTWPDPTFTFMSKVMAGAGLFGALYHAEEIDLTDYSPRTAPEMSTSPEYGAYVVGFHGCKSCHGDQLNGFKSPDPVSPPGANITPGGNLGKWDLAAFTNTLRSGTTPEGVEMDPKFMPWAAIGLMSDMEIEAVYNYLKSLPALPDDETVVKYKEKQK